MLEARYFYLPRNRLPSKAAKGSPSDRRYPNSSAVTGAGNPLPRYFADRAVCDAVYPESEEGTPAPVAADIPAPAVLAAGVVAGLGYNCGEMCRQVVEYSGYT